MISIEDRRASVSIEEPDKISIAQEVHTDQCRYQASAVSCNVPHDQESERKRNTFGPPLFGVS